jgi:hypothetical protein
MRKTGKLQFPQTIHAVAQLEGLASAVVPEEGFSRQRLGGWSRQLRKRGFQLENRKVEGKMVTLVVGHEAIESIESPTMDTVRELLEKLYTCIEAMHRKLEENQERIMQLEAIKLPPPPPIVSACLVQYG